MDQKKTPTYIQIGGKKFKKGGTKSRKGGSVLADISVPAGLLFLNQFLKRRKTNSKKVIKNVTKKANKKSNKKSNKKADKKN